MGGRGTLLLSVKEMKGRPHVELPRPWHDAVLVCTLVCRQHNLQRGAGVSHAEVRLRHACAIVGEQRRGSACSSVQQEPYEVLLAVKELHHWPETHQA